MTRSEAQELLHAIGRDILKLHLASEEEMGEAQIAFINLAAWLQQEGILTELMHAADYASKTAEGGTRWNPLFQRKPKN